MTDLYRILWVGASDSDQETLEGLISRGVLKLVPNVDIDLPKLDRSDYVITAGGYVGWSEDE